jgi:hypothetical protein
VTEHVCHRTGCKEVPDAKLAKHQWRQIDEGRWIARQKRQEIRPGLLGWTFAMTLVLAAVLGPPLTGQTIPTMVELRHDVLMIDREFERWTISSNRSDEQEHRLTEASRDG